MDPFDVFSRIDERPLDFLVSDGGFSRIFRTICCIGDSLSSGEFEIVNEKGITEYHDIYPQSWGQYLARMNGATVYNFSRGGMTAQEYCDKFADEMGYWDPKFASQAYILALGINELLFFNSIPLGTIDDVCLSDWRANKRTFAGCYGQIIQRIQADNPNAKLFLMTMPRSDQDTPQQQDARRNHAALLHQFSDRFSNTYVMDFHQYAPVFDERFRKLYFMRGHMNPCGYLLMAQMIASYLDYLIRTHMEDFHQIGLV